VFYGIYVQFPSFDLMDSTDQFEYSITLLLLPSQDDSLAPSSDLVLSLLDEKTNAPGWKWSSKAPPLKATPATTVPSSATAERPRCHSQLTFPDPKEFIAAIQRACKNLVAAEPEITRMDSIARDGDCGLIIFFFC
jgi:triose/dihydroxyacetone kinase / FAD-AMP lyase (cyclizing)